MTGLILKLSYNFPGEVTLHGGICGSFFFLVKGIAVTAYHVLNKEEFKPNEGYKHCQFWLILEPNIIHPIEISDIFGFPEIDTTFIKFNGDQEVTIRECDTNDINLGTPCFNEGFIGGQMPAISIAWINDKLVISDCNSSLKRVLGEGFVKAKKNLSVKAVDINFHNVDGLETSYGGIIGMSGAPLINRNNDSVIGLMSIGLPPNISVKTTLFAVSCKLLLKKLEIIKQNRY